MVGEHSPQHRCRRAHGDHRNGQTLVAASDWPDRLTLVGKVGGTWWQRSRNVGGTSRWCDRHGQGCGEQDWGSVDEQGWANSGEGLRTWSGMRATVLAQLADEPQHAVSLYISEEGGTCTAPTEGVETSMI